MPYLTFTVLSLVSTVNPYLYITLYIRTKIEYKLKMLALQQITFKT